MAITIAPAVIATCDYCKKESRPCSEKDAKTFLEQHKAQHYGEARYEVMKRHGHAVEVKDQWMTCDDSGGHIECSCGHKGSTSKLCWMNEHIDQHLAPLAGPFEDEIQQELARMKKIGLPPTA